MLSEQAGILKKLKPLRIILLVSALLTIVLRFIFRDVPLETSDWAVLGNILMPVLAPILFMLLMLDALMSRVWISQTEGAEQQRMKLIMRVDLVAGGLLLLYWLPFFISLGK